MHPLKISLYISVVLLAMLGLTYVSEPHAVANGKVQDGFRVQHKILKYPTSATFFKAGSLSKEQKDAIESIVGNIEGLVGDGKKKDRPEIPDYTKIDSTKIERISYPGPPGEFVSKLLTQLKSIECRIIHYGDSQLEGDRISAYLRNRLQVGFGGSGPGFIPIKQEYHQISAEVIPSDNWMRYAAFDPTKPLFEPKNYGAFLSVSRFTEIFDPVLDSLAIMELEPTKATIDLRPSTRLYSRLKEYTKIGLHYGNTIAPVSIKVYNGGNLIKDEMLISDGKYHCFNIEFPSTPAHLKLVLEGEISPDFYGLTLDGNSGISLDNVAMRGSSGTVFAGLDSEAFGGMYTRLGPKVIIFQYGGNTVPYLKDSIAVRNYSSYLKNHINWVRRRAPEASILFVGPSDMATMVNGELKSYALLPYLDEELKRACLSNNVAYWSMFKAMGGENSLQYWFQQNLMGSDFTHFTASGTQIISELFFTALNMDLKNIK